MWMKRRTNKREKRKKKRERCTSKKRKRKERKNEDVVAGRGEGGERVLDTRLYTCDVVEVVVVVVLVVDVVVLHRSLLPVDLAHQLALVRLNVLC